MSKISQSEKGSPHQLVVLSDDEVRQLITAREAIKVVGEAFSQLHTKDAQVRCLLASRTRSRRFRFFFDLFNFEMLNGPTHAFTMLHRICPLCVYSLSALRFVLSHLNKSDHHQCVFPGRVIGKGRGCLTLLSPLIPFSVPSAQIYHVY
jgi:hypothetical protein